MRRPRVAHIHLLIVRRKTNPVRLVHLVFHFFHRAGLPVNPVHRFLQQQIAFVPLVVSQRPIPRIREPNIPLRMHHNVIRRVVLLPLKFFRQHRDTSVVLVAHHAPRPVFAAQLPPLKIKRVPIRIVGRTPKRAHMSVFFQPAHLPVVRNVAEHQIFPNAIPRRPLRPQHSRI